MTALGPAPLAPPPPPPRPPAPPRRRGVRHLRLIVGGGTIALALLVVLAVGLTTLLRDDGPEEVAEEFLEAGFSAEYETYCELWTEESRQDELDSADVRDCEGYAEQATEDEEPDFRSLLADVDIEIAVGAVSEDEDDEDTVTVEWAIVWSYTGDDPEGAEDLLSMDGRVGAYDGELVLVEEDGEWKVDADSL